MNSNGKLEQIFRQFHKQLKRFIVTRVRDDETADDILQEVFLKVHANIERLRDTSKIESWLYQITRNAIFDYYRTRRHSEKLPEEIIEDEKSENPLHKISDSVNRFIDQLPEEYRDAILMTDLKGATQKELAEKQGLSLSGAKSRVQRGRKMLREMLFECCHFEFDRSGGVVDYYPHESACCPVCEKRET